MDIPAKQYLDWANRILAGEHLEEEMQNAGALPNANTPLPPTNATIHLLAREDGYGTPHRRFTMLCGVSWNARESTGEHKYFMPADHYWHRHINCPTCRNLMGSEHD
jgi:hypothetical protein